MKLLRHVCLPQGTSYFSLGVLPMFKCVFWYGSAVFVLVSIKRPASPAERPVSGVAGPSLSIKRPASPAERPVSGVAG